MPVRLVKGAYWDTEIKRAQVQGLAGYPVFTRKRTPTFPIWRAPGRCSRRATRVYPMFATHNAHTIAWVSARAQRSACRLRVPAPARNGRRALPVVRGSGGGAHVACRVYAPVGGHRDLLPYLVRRLLENGANTSFVNRIGDPQVAIDDLVADPLARARSWDFAPATRIPLPADIFAPERHNSAGVSLADQPAMAALDETIARSADRQWTAMPVGMNSSASQGAREVLEPADRRRRIGLAVDAEWSSADRTLAALVEGQRTWDAQPAHERASILDRAADLLEADLADWMVLLAREAGKTRAAAIAEVREAADFCRYYAAQARQRFAEPLRIAITDGRIEHARAAWPWGVRVHIAVEFSARDLHRADCRRAGRGQCRRRQTCRADGADRVRKRSGRCTQPACLPRRSRSCPGPANRSARNLCADARIAGVAFTGSTAVGSAIAQALAARTPIVPLIAETGGQNAMIVDSSALAEQVVADVVQSAFDSAGQRCSALRVLCLQEDIAPRVHRDDRRRDGRARRRRSGDLATDVGPVIDAAARDALEAHVAQHAGGRARAPSRRTAARRCATARSSHRLLIVLRPRRSPDAGSVRPGRARVRHWRADELDALIDGSTLSATG